MQQYLRQLLRLKCFSSSKRSTDDVLLCHCAVVLPCRYNKDWLVDTQTHTTTELQLRNARYLMSAQCSTKNMYVNSDGFNEQLVTYNGTAAEQCTVFLIQGMPWAAVAPQLQSGYAWQYTFIAICALKLLAMAGTAVNKQH
jgi:hypothetical protein